MENSLQIVPQSSTTSGIRYVDKKKKKNRINYLSKIKTNNYRNFYLYSTSPAIKINSITNAVCLKLISTGFMLDDDRSDWLNFDEPSSFVDVPSVVLLFWNSKKFLVKKSRFFGINFKFYERNKSYSLNPTTTNNEMSNENMACYIIEQVKQ